MPLPARLINYEDVVYEDVVLSEGASGESADFSRHETFHAARPASQS